QAKIERPNPKMFNSSLDGSKPAIETSAVCNATGLTPAPAGLAYPAGRIDQIPNLMRPRAEGGVLHHKGQVEVVSSLQPDGTPGDSPGSGADAVACAKGALQPGELLDGEGGYTVVGRLMPAADSLAQGCLPLGLAHGWKVLKPVAAGQPVRWSDIAVDESVAAVRLRREMETEFRARERHAA